jgi:hypothetical protein
MDLRENARFAANLDDLALEARWHAAATAVILPLVLLGMVPVAAVLFGVTEAGLVTAKRRLRRSGGGLLPVRVKASRSA